MTQVIGDAMDSAQLANNVAYLYDTSMEVAQFNFFNDTLKFFKPRMLPLEGQGLYFYAYTQPLTPVRRTKSMEAEFPEAFDVDHVPVPVAWSYLSEFQATVSYTGLAQRMTRNKKLSVFQVAKRLVAEANKHFAASVNMALHQDTNGVMALVNGTPLDLDGNTMSSDTTCFIPIDTGSISQFVQGMILSVGATAGTADTIVEVNDVIYGATYNGPGSLTGPAIVVTRDDARCTAASLTSTVDTIADNDSIWLFSEDASCNLDGFPTWFSTTSVLGLTRTEDTAGYQWSVPHIRDASSNVFDYDTYFRPLVVQMGRAVKAGRVARKEDGLTITPNMVLLTTPELVDEITSALQDTKRAMVSFTTDMDQNQRRKLFGDVGFDGVVLHHPSLPAPIAVQSDPVATPDTIRLLEPSSWAFVTGHNGNSLKPEWLKEGENMWLLRSGDNGRPVNQKMASAFIRLELICDQPKANGAITSVTSSLTI